MKTLFSIPTLFIMIFALGCSTPQHLSNASGKPEVTVNTSDRDYVKDAFTNAMINRGYTLVNESRSSMSFTKPMGVVMGTLYKGLFGNKYDTHPNLVVSYNIFSAGSQTRVVANLSTHSQGAFGQNKGDSFVGTEEGDRIQAFMQGVKAEIEGQISPLQNAASTPASTSYYISRDGKQYGPFSESKIREMMQSRRVTASDYIWTEGMSQWDTVENVFNR